MNGEVTAMAWTQRVQSKPRFLTALVHSSLPALLAFPACAGDPTESATDAVIFESNWNTGVGADSAAIMDFNAPYGRWDIWEDGSGGTLQGGAYIMEIVGGIAPPGY